MIITKDEMIEQQLIDRGITNPEVLKAVADVDRIDFVPNEKKHIAYEDRPLPIGRGQTISQPYIVAYMAQKLDLEPDFKVLEIGTGCGYNAAILSRLVSEVYSIEIIEWLAELARENLAKTDIDNVSARYGDGYKGWPEKGPFDRIVLTAAPASIPEPLKDQLKVGGKLLAPVGKFSQKLVMLERTSDDEYEEFDLLPVSFVPMTGEAER